MTSALARPRKTIEDLQALPEGVLAELIDGEIYVTPTPFEEHQEAVGFLHASLLAYARQGRRGRVLLAPFDVYLPSGDVVHPDILWVSNERAGIIHRGAHGAPDLTVEVLGTTRRERDRIVKLRLYAANGVKEYWIVDPEARGIEVFALAEGGYRPAGWFTSGTRLASALLPGFTVPVDEVFANPSAGPGVTEPDSPR